jgi:hypothetical protein
MKKLTWIILLGSIGCSPTLRVYSDYDRDFNVHKYQSYQWTEKTNIEGHNNPLFYNELNDKRIKKTADDLLRAKGLVLTADAPEIILHYHIIIDDKSSLVPEPYGFYGPYWMRPGGRVVQYKEGTLIFDFMDAKTNNLAWRGWAVSVIDDDGQLREETLTRAIVKILDRFPKR